MQTLGAMLGDVSPGQVEIFLAPKREISSSTASATRER